VESVAPVYLGMSSWKNPETGRTRDIFTIGVDPTKDVFDSDEVRAQLSLVRYPDVVLFDEYSRPEYGPVAMMFREAGEVSTEARNRNITVRGLFKMGTSFGVDGTIFTSDINFMRINTHIPPAKVGIGVVRMKPGVDVKAVQAQMRAALPHDVKIVTKQEMIDHEVGYW